MAIVGLVVKQGVKEANNLAIEVIKWIHKRGHTVLIENGTLQRLMLMRDSDIDLKDVESRFSPDLISESDVIVSLGGDGSLIGIARYVNEHSPILIGVNFGTLGFLTEIAPEEIFETLEAFFHNKVSYGTRLMLHVEVIRGREVVFTSQGVNDAVIQKGTKSPMVSLNLSVNSESVMCVRADGLIVATPTGSTAYSLAAGGSIVYPSLGVYLVTPICPHSLTCRPLILPIDAELSVDIPVHNGEIILNVDGQVTYTLKANDSVRIIRSKHEVKFVRSASRSYFDILRGKLNWG